MEGEGFSRLHKFIMLWIYLLIALNVFYLIFKCFMRTISIMINPDSVDLDVFDVVHKHRFLLFSIVDILNGLSVLYCFFCVADLSKKSNHHTDHHMNIFSKKQSGYILSEDSVNTQGLNKILS